MKETKITLENFDFCAKHGWMLAARWGKMQIFYNEKENPIPIENDPVIQVDTINRSMKKSLFPTHLLLLALCVFQLILMSLEMHSLPVEFLSKPTSLYLFFMFVLLAISTASEMYSYIRWHQKAKRAAINGNFYDVSRVFYSTL